ncbi:urease accessory protein UreD [Paenibacillus sp. GCM10023252]|uniref:urease accessory protein UreD n=1 Tax=Paenibacillus sp. GCM10023252 TaxID=3252649 RepID=UPI0036245AB2
MLNSLTIKAAGNGPGKAAGDAPELTAGKEAGVAAGKEAGERSSELRAELTCRGGNTILSGRYHTAPIKIAKSFPLHGGALGIIVMDVSPGMLEGDRYRLHWLCGPGTHVLITNQSYTKVHPSAKLGSSMQQSFVLEEGAIVEHMPEPVMLYREALFHSQTEVRLAPGSVWMQAEVLCPGRTMRGEQFDYQLFRNELTVRYGDELIYTQRQRIEPGVQRLGAPGCFEELTHWGTFYVFGDRLKEGHVEQLKAYLLELPVRESHPVLAGISATYRYGLAVTAGAASAWILEETLRSVWREARKVITELESVDWIK